MYYLTFFIPQIHKVHQEFIARIRSKSEFHLFIYPSPDRPSPDLFFQYTIGEINQANPSFRKR